MDSFKISLYVFEREKLREPVVRESKTRERKINKKKCNYLNCGEREPNGLLAPDFQKKTSLHAGQFYFYSVIKFTSFIAATQAILTYKNFYSN